MWVKILILFLMFFKKGNVNVNKLFSSHLAHLPKRGPQVILVAALCMAVLGGAFSFAPSAHAATLAGSSTGHAITHAASKSAPLTSSGSHTVVPFINRVSDAACTGASGTQFFKLWNGTTSAGGLCFANNGQVSVNIFNVSAITSGNNKGFVVDHNGDQFSLCQFQELDHFIAHVVLVSITGRTC